MQQRQQSLGVARVVHCRQFGAKRSANRAEPFLTATNRAADQSRGLNLGRSHGGLPLGAFWPFSQHRGGGRFLVLREPKQMAATRTRGVRSQARWLDSTSVATNGTPIRFALRCSRGDDHPTLSPVMRAAERGNSGASLHPALRYVHRFPELSLYRSTLASGSCRRSATAFAGQRSTHSLPQIPLRLRQRVERGFARLNLMERAAVFWYNDATRTRSPTG